MRQRVEGLAGTQDLFLSMVQEPHVVPHGEPHVVPRVKHGFCVFKVSIFLPALSVPPFISLF